MVMTHGRRCPPSAVLGLLLLMSLGRPAITVHGADGKAVNIRAAVHRSTISRLYYTNKI